MSRAEIAAEIRAEIAADLRELDDPMLDPSRIAEIYEKNSARYRDLGNEFRKNIVQVDQAVAQHPLVSPELFIDLPERDGDQIAPWTLKNVAAPYWILDAPEHVVRILFKQWTRLLVIYVEKSLQTKLFLDLTQHLGAPRLENAAVESLRSIAKRDGLNTAYEAYTALRSAQQQQAQMGAAIMEDILRLPWTQQVANTVMGFFNIVRQKSGPLQAAVSSYQYAVRLCASLDIPPPPAIYESLL